MKGGEARLWQRMRPGIEPFVFAQRIENMVGEGVPDLVLHSRLSGDCAFVELKFRPELPLRADTPVFKGDYGLRPEQVAWLHDRSMIGANCWILAQCRKDLWLIHGRFAWELATFSREMLDNRCELRVPSWATDWGKVCRAIFG